MTPEQQRLLDDIYKSIDQKEELRLSQSNPRQLSAKDTADLRGMAFAGCTVDDLFDYANRPKGEVLQYMQDRHPAYLARMLSNTLNKKDLES